MPINPMVFQNEPQIVYNLVGLDRDMSAMVLMALFSIIVLLVSDMLFDTKPRRGKKWW